MPDKQEPMTIKRDEVCVKPHSYQPTKAELEEPIDIRQSDGSRPTFRQFVDKVLRPVKIIEDPEA